MSLFHVIEDGFAILRLKKGVFKQAKLYHRDDHIYAAGAGGFIRIMADHGTSHPDISWREIVSDARVSVPRTGAVTYLPAVKTVTLGAAA